MMLSTPALFNMATSGGASSCVVSACTRPPNAAYSPSELRARSPSSSGPLTAASGLVDARAGCGGGSHVGVLVERLSIASRRPHSVMWSGLLHAGEPNRMGHGL